MRCRGVFDIDIACADSKLSTLRIKSTLGGNCRLRLAANTNLEGDATLQSATGENAKPFYQVHAIKAPLTSEKANLKGFQLPDNKLVALNTEPGEQYTITNTL